MTIGAVRICGCVVAAAAVAGDVARAQVASPAKGNATASRIEPTYAEVVYGSHPRNVLDFWQAAADGPVPLVVFIHGGGFQTFSKERIRPDFVRQLLSAQISVAAINYRYVSLAPLPAAFEDSRRAVQYLRSRAREWKIDPGRIGAYGGSAGAMISMWLAFHDDMAEPNHSDPVQRHSTRLSCVATQGGQITFDRYWMQQSIPGDVVHKNPAFLRLFQVESLAELERPDVLRAVRELSPVTHVSAGDPPIYMEYAMAPWDRVPEDPAAIKPWALHHVIFGITLQVRLQALGIEAALRYPGRDAAYRSIPDFFVKQFSRDG